MFWMPLLIKDQLAQYHIELNALEKDFALNSLVVVPALAEVCIILSPFFYPEIAFLIYVGDFSDNNSFT